MGTGELLGFREYLQSLPDELLECVSEDYVWLAAMDFGPNSDFPKRKECCREECFRRGVPDLYRHAEAVVSPFAA